MVLPYHHEGRTPGPTGFSPESLRDGFQARPGKSIGKKRRLMISRKETPPSRIKNVDASAGKRWQDARRPGSEVAFVPRKEWCPSV